METATSFIYQCDEDGTELIINFDSVEHLRLEKNRAAKIIQWGVKRISGHLKESGRRTEEGSGRITETLATSRSEHG